MWATLRKRDLYLNRIIAFQDTEMIKVITGIRRCGKSSLMKLMAQHLRDTGVSDEQIIEIRILHEVLNVRPLDISKKMNIPSNYVSAILKYKRWPDLKPTEEQIKIYIEHIHDNPLLRLK